MRCARVDAPHLARPEGSLIFSDPERERPAKDEPELLVLMAVLGHDGAGIELDDRKRDLLTVHGAGEDPLEELLRLDSLEVVECAHSGSGAA